MQAAGFSLLGWRLFQLQVLGQSRYAPMADDNRISMQALMPKRGRILDRNGAVLADNEDVFRATLVPARAGNTAKVVAAFSRIVPLPQDEVEKIVRRARRAGRHSAIIIASDLTFEQVAGINLLAPQLPGIRTEIFWRRKYPLGPVAGHITGYTGSADRAAQDEDAGLRLSGARVGKAGLEAAMDTNLRGSSGSQKIEVDARGQIVRSLESVDPKPGRDVVSTIDLGVQTKVTELMAQERRAACAVMDVKTGGIIALVSVPGYDPGTLSEGMTDEVWQRLANSDDKPLLNRATAGQYPPGGTFKIVTALAALTQGKVTASEEVTCPGSFQAGEHTFHCSNRAGHGQVQLSDALRQSCDVYFLELATRLDPEALSGMARDLGLMQTYGLGLVPPRASSQPDTERQSSGSTAAATQDETLLAAIGQGKILATPLGLAVMSARIATGRAVVPSLVTSSDTFEVTGFPVLDCDEAALTAVRNGLIAAVNGDNGYAANARLAEGKPTAAGLPGMSLITPAATGEEQEALAFDARGHSLFVGYVPADVPRFAVAAVVEHGGMGGGAAAVLGRRTLEAVLQSFPLPPQNPALPDGGGAPDTSSADRREG